MGASPFFLGFCGKTFLKEKRLLFQPILNFTQ